MCHSKDERLLMQIMSWWNTGSPWQKHKEYPKKHEVERNEPQAVVYSGNRRAVLCHEQM